MVNWDQLNNAMLPIVSKKLAAIRNLPQGDKYDAITDMIANISLSADEKIKLRGRLFNEFGFAPKDFNDAFSCRFSVALFEKVGRGK